MCDILGSWPTGSAAGAAPPRLDEASRWLTQLREGKPMSGRLVLVRHGQSHGNVDRRLDTRPPGAALTDLGRDQARAFARDWPHPPAMLAHSVALRAVADRRRDRRRARTATPTSSRASTRFRSASWRTATTTTRSRSSTTVYQRWHEGELDVPMPGGETGNEVLDRYVPVLTAAADALPRRRRVARRHRRGQPRRGDPAGGRRAGRRRRQLRPRPSPGQRRIRGAGADHRRAVELRAVGRR